MSKTPEEVLASLGLSAPRETHYLHVAARDPDFEGMAALCDHVAGLEETPRVATLSSAIAEEVTCSDCLNLMIRE